jgi:hypothetical protein
MQVQRVDISHVNQVWPMVEQFIADALEHSCGDYTLEQAKTLVAMGHWTLLVAVDDAGVEGRGYGIIQQSPKRPGCLYYSHWRQTNF